MFLKLKFFLADVRALLKTEPNPLAGVLGVKTDRGRTLLRVWMQVIISGAVLSLDAWVILDPNQSQQNKDLAFGTLGTVIGYWLG
jgi:hypothetical protein